MNRRGTTWRRLSPEAQARADDAQGAIALMVAQPTLIRRPVVECGDQLIVGFDAADYAHRFGR